MPTCRHLLALALAAPSLALAGKWTYGGRVGASQNGNTIVPSFAVSAQYSMNKYLTWRTDLEASFRDVSKMDEFALSVPTQLLVHPLGSDALFDPYVGPGLSVSMDFDRQVAAGAHAVAGLSIHPRKGQTFGLEARWGWPDLVHGEPSAWALALTGNWSAKFGNM